MNETMIEQQHDKRIEDPYKAELMAYACAPYLPFEMNAREAGLTEVAGDIVERREQAATVVAERYDKEQQWMRTMLLGVTEKAMAYVEIFKNEKRPNQLREELVAGFNFNSDVGAEFLDRIHALFGCQEEAAQTTWEEVVVIDRYKRENENYELAKELTIQSFDTSFKENEVKIYTNQGALVREIPTSLGINLKELRHNGNDISTIIICLGTPYVFQEEVVAGKEESIRWALEKARADSLEGKRVDSDGKRLLQHYDGLEGDGLNNAIRAAAELSDWKRYKETDWIGLKPRNE